MPGTKIPDWINEIGMIGIGGFKIIALTLGIKFNTVMCYRNSPADCLNALVNNSRTNAGNKITAVIITKVSHFSLLH